MDAIKFMQQFKTGTIQGIVTSPPYNKKFKNRLHSNWKNSKLMADNYDTYNDDMPSDEYIVWQQNFLMEAMRLIGDDGVIMYNIGRNICNLIEDRREKIIEGFPVRQTIVWNRKSTNNQGGSKPTIFPPIYELIYLIAGKNWRLPQKYIKEMRFWGDVWSISFETKNPHPAPFPIKLAERMVKVVDGTVIDPFAGSGTVGIAAHKLGYKYYLSDISLKYKDMFMQRIKKIENQTALF